MKTLELAEACRAWQLYHSHHVPVGDWRPSLLQHMSKLQRCCSVKEACLRIAVIFHTALWGQDAFYIWVYTKKLLFSSVPEEGFPVSHLAWRTVYLFPYWRLKCHARQIYWDPLSLWRMLAAISSQPWMFPVHPGSGLLPFAWDVWTTQLCSAQSSLNHL